MRKKKRFLDKRIQYYPEFSWNSLGKYQKCQNGIQHCFSHSRTLKITELSRYKWQNQQEMRKNVVFWWELKELPLDFIATTKEIVKPLRISSFGIYFIKSDILGLTETRFHQTKWRKPRKIGWKMFLDTNVLYQTPGKRLLKHFFIKNKFDLWAIHLQISR